MKKIFFLLIGLSLNALIYAQTRAVTETGDPVILYDNGTWKFENEEVIEAKEIPLNPKEFFKNDNATFLIKSSKINLGFWIDPKKWLFKKAVDNPDAEYELQLKGEDLYGMIISEKMEIPIETLKTIALENGKSVAPDLQIEREEYRVVNGLKVLLLQMSGNMQGIKFAYYGYYFSNSSGTIQFVTYTAKNLLEDYKKNSEELLNGIVEVE